MTKPDFKLGNLFIDQNGKPSGLKWLSMVILMLFFAGNSVYAQKVSGTVLDENNSGLPGVSVVVKGTTTGTTTDFDGNFSLNAPASATLVFSFIGYLPQEFSLGSQTDGIKISMKPDVQQLEEIVVVGYGEIKKRDITGAMTSVTSKEFNVGPIASPEQLMQGRAAGVVISSNNGEPGSGVSVRIRGGTSITGSSSPLYVVDGMPIDNGSNSASGSGNDISSAPPKNPLNFLNPNDIESIDILKDASACAIYGSRGANGVIIITTKKGKQGKMTLDYNTYVGVSQIYRKLDLLTAADYRSYVQSNNLTNQLGTANTDWQDALTRNAVTHNHDISFGGGTENTQYRVSLNYFNQQGIVLKSGMERTNIRVNATHKMFENKLVLGMNLTTGLTTDNNIPYTATGGFSGGTFTNVFKMNPTFPVTNADGSYYEYPTPSIRNPVALVNQVDDVTKTQRILGNFSAEYEVIPGLRAKLNVGADRSTSVRKSYIPKASPAGSPVGGIATIGNVDAVNLLLEATLSYNKEVMPGHNLSAIAGYMYQDFIREGFGVTARNFITDGFSYNSLGAGADNSVKPYSFKSLNTLISFMGRVNYDIKGKYLFTATIRRDGSSRFGANNKWGIFPSGSFAWRMSDEAFMSSAKSSISLSDLKVRVGYGVTGNQEIGNYRSLDLMNANPDYRAIFGLGDQVALAGVFPIQVSNLNLKWEQTSSINAGIDFGFLAGRITGSVDYYLKNTTGLLVEYNIPSPSAARTYLNNAGAVDNQGVEFMINTINVDKQEAGGLKWETGFNISANRNKVTSLGNEADGAKGDIITGLVSGAGQTSTFAQIIQVGQPIGTFYGPEFQGIENGIEKLSSTKGVIGNAQASFNYGLSNRLYYKQFDLNIFIRGTQGGKIFNNTALEYATKNGVDNNINALKVALTDGVKAGESQVYSSRWLENASFLRIDNITLGYTMKAGSVKWLSMLRLYATVQNAFVFTSYTGYDPEISNGAVTNNVASIGIDYASYPRPRQYMVGLSIGF